MEKPDKVFVCSRCGHEVKATDYAAQVDHMYQAHQARTDDEARHMASMLYEVRYVSPR